MSGRNPLGPKLVRHLDGSEQAKIRLETILETLSGRLTVREGCRRLGIGEARFYVVRKEVLQAGLQQLEPRRLGRPAQQEIPGGAAIRQLQQRLEATDIERHTAEVRLEIAQTMPQLLSQGASKKTPLPKPHRVKPQKKRRHNRTIR